jgi:DNA-binding CsgD family transcriptional regulator/PAS domain-containing protein
MRIQAKVITMEKPGNAFGKDQSHPAKADPIEVDQPGSIKWVFDPIIHLDPGTETDQDLLQSKNLLLSTLDCIQDGVSILDTDLNVRYVNTSMKYWYSTPRDFIGEKCYLVYHNRIQPCENCPILNTISKKAPHIGIVKYTQGGRDKGWQELFAIPILNGKDELVGVLEYVRDISYQYKLEHDLNRIMEQFQSLEKRNEAISQLLAQRKLEREQLEETIAQNFEKFIKPSLNYLKTRSDAHEVNLVETLIEEIVYPFTKNRSSILDKLTAREMQIVSLIKEGKSSEEIAKTLVVSKKTVDFHRANIRKKLSLQTETGGRINLMTYLISHM